MSLPEIALVLDVDGQMRSGRQADDYLALILSSGVETARAQLIKSIDTYKERADRT